MTKRLLAIGVAMVMVIGLIELATPGGAGAASVSKNLTGTCNYADKPTADLLGPLVGPFLTIGFRVDADVPKTLNPGESGVPVSFSWTVTLDDSLTSKAGAAGVKQVTVRNAKLDTNVEGATSTKLVLGRPAPQVIALTAGAALTQGPFTGTLDNVGQSGVIRYSAGEIALTITVSIGGDKDLNLTCVAPGQIASTPIKVPGSPDITQPIDVPAGPGQAVAVDVLGQFVTAGVTPIVPSSLKVVDGPGSIQNGQLVITAGGAPSANAVTFEVCGVPKKTADAVAGKSETQHLTLDKNVDPFKRTIGFTLAYDGQETGPIWAAAPNSFLGAINLPYGMPTAKVPDWLNQSLNFSLWTDPVEPSAAAIQSALEKLPNIGAGNVAVTRTANREYDITFQGSLGNKNVNGLKMGTHYSNLPQETLNDILTAAGKLQPTGPTTTTTLPAGLSANDYIVQLVLQGNIDEAGNVLSGQLLGGIDVSATLAGLTALFPANPSPATPPATDGVDPIPEQYQDLCSQGSATATVAAPPKPAAAAAPPAFFFAPPAVKSASSARCTTQTRKVRVRIKGTKKYRTVTKRVTVCKKAKVTKKKSSRTSSKYRKSSRKSSTKASRSSKKSSRRR